MAPLLSVSAAVCRLVALTVFVLLATPALSTEEIEKYSIHTVVGRWHSVKTWFSTKKEFKAEALLSGLRHVPLDVYPDGDCKMDFFPNHITGEGTWACLPVGPGDKCRSGIALMTDTLALKYYRVFRPAKALLVICAAPGVEKVKGKGNKVHFFKMMSQRQLADFGRHALEVDLGRPADTQPLTLDFHKFAVTFSGGVLRKDGGVDPLTRDRNRLPLSCTPVKASELEVYELTRALIIERSPTFHHLRSTDSGLVVEAILDEEGKVADLKIRHFSPGANNLPKDNVLAILLPGKFVEFSVEILIDEDEEQEAEAAVSGSKKAKSKSKADKKRRAVYRFATKKFGQTQSGGSEKATVILPHTDTDMKLAAMALVREYRRDGDDGKSSGASSAAAAASGKDSISVPGTSASETRRQSRSETHVKQFAASEGSAVAAKAGGDDFDAILSAPSANDAAKQPRSETHFPIALEGRKITRSSSLHAAFEDYADAAKGEENDLDAIGSAPSTNDAAKQPRSETHFPIGRKNRRRSSWKH